MTDFEQALQYQRKAAQMRALADEDPHLETRAMLLQVAATYEQMAASMFRIDRVNETLSASANFAGTFKCAS